MSGIAVLFALFASFMHGPQVPAVYTYLHVLYWTAEIGLKN